MARLGDSLNQSQRIIRSTRGKGATPIVRRTFSGAAMLAAVGDDTKRPDGDWERLEAPVAARTFVGVLAVAMVGTKDTGNHTVVEGAARTIIGA
ncbi:MAG: hypothetical protein ABFE07_28035 [Armatimonadia bacterium]